MSRTWMRAAVLMSAVPLAAVAVFALVVRLTGIAPVPVAALLPAVVVVAAGAVLGAERSTARVRRTTAEPATGELADLRERVDAHARERQRFVEVADRALRHPLDVLRGGPELMALDPVAGRHAVREQLDRLEAVPGDLAQLADAAAPGVARPARVGLAALTVDADARLRSLPGHREWVLDAVADGEARLDRARVLAAVERLGRHAADHARPGEEIRFGSSRDDAVVRVWVAWYPAGEPAPDALGPHVADAVARAHGGVLRRTDGPGDHVRLAVELRPG